MPRFVGTLSVSPYPDNRTWYLNRKLSYVRPNETIKIPKNFETDLASVPQAFQNIFPRFDDYGLASILHDWTYWAQTTTRMLCDDMFLEAMIVSGVTLWKRQTLYRFVRAFGQAAWDDNTRIAQEGFSRVRTRASPDTPAWHR